MASIEQNPKSKRYHIRFRFRRREFKRSLKTSDRKQALAALARVEETISLVHRGVLEMPQHVDPTVFLLSNGRRANDEPLPDHFSLDELFTKYQRSLPTHAKEASTLETEEIHIRHFRKHLPVRKPATSITTDDVQTYVNQQLKRKRNGRPISPETVKRQMDTLRSIYNWATKQELFNKLAPTTGLVYPKRDERQPFRTRTEIERIIDRGGLDEHQIKDLWDSLYLTIPEVHEVLDSVQTDARYPFVFPMFAFVAYTGARRSEMMRALIDDFDLANGSVLVRERKKSRSKSTTYRRVEMPSRLADIMRKWFDSHPGGQFAFCHDFGIIKRDCVVGLSRDQARTQFDKTIRDTRWSIIRGFHVFRHSYASNLAASGVDQRIIDKHMGHQTEEMRRRYQHLRPAVCKVAVEVLVARDGDNDQGHL